MTGQVAPIAPEAEGAGPATGISLLAQIALLIIATSIALSLALLEVSIARSRAGRE